MTVFRGYLAIAKKNIHVIIMYFVIVTSLTVVMQNISRDNAGKQFELKKMDVGIVDRDKSELSEFIVKYLSGLHNVTAMEDDKSKLQESLYYNDRDCIIQIPKGFSKGAFEGEKQLEITKQPGSYGYVYLKQQVNELLNQFKTYISAGYGISEAYDKIAEKEESRIKLIDVSGNGGELPAHSYLFGFYPYLCISILCNILGLIISTFRKRDIKNRIAASAVSIKSQICGSVMSFIFIGTVIWFLSCIVLSAVLYGTDFYGSSNCGLYLINSYAIMLAILAISYLVGSIAKNALVVNIIVTPLSLAM